MAVDKSGVQDKGDIWIFNLGTPAATRLTSDVVNESRPVWSPDDSKLAYRTSGKTDTMYARHVDGPKRETTFHAVVNEGDIFPMDWSPDGQHIVFTLRYTDGSARSDIWIYSVKDGQSSPFIESSDSDSNGQFSPDGRWLV